MVICSTTVQVFNIYDAVNRQLSSGPETCKFTTLNPERHFRGILLTFKNRRPSGYFRRFLSEIKTFQIDPTKVLPTILFLF